MKKSMKREVTENYTVTLCDVCGKDMGDSYDPLNQHSVYFKVEDKNYDLHTACIVNLIPKVVNHATSTK